MDEAHLRAAFAYVALNPVRAGLAARAEDWRWSSARAQLGIADDGLTDAAPLRARVPDFAAMLAAPAEEAASLALRRAETIGRPVGDGEFLASAEAKLDRPLAAAKRGRKKREPEWNALSPNYPELQCRRIAN